jgi:hypothetical protein
MDDPQGSLQALTQIVSSCELILHSSIIGEQQCVEVRSWKARHFLEKSLIRCLWHEQGFCRSAWPKSSSIWFSIAEKAIQIVPFVTFCSLCESLQFFLCVGQS